jgi:hypothetical protein
MTEPKTPYIRWFRELSLVDLPLVGGKNASLGEMFQRLAPLGVRVPDGFAVTAQAYRDALDAAGVWAELHALLDRLDKRDTDALARAGARARELVYGVPMPAAVEQQLRAAWRQLKAQLGEDLSVAVRSSATAEDLPTASFAGQHDTYLNVRGEEMLVDAVRRCQASLFTDRAISYRTDQGFDRTSSGPRTAPTGRSTSSRRAPRRRPRASAATCSRSMCSTPPARCACRAARSAPGSPAAPCAASSARMRWPASAPARCWSPTPRRPTGSRS